MKTIESTMVSDHPKEYLNATSHSFIVSGVPPARPASGGHRTSNHGVPRCGLSASRLVQYELSNRGVSPLTPLEKSS